MSISNQILNENDFESPGYEYLRSYQNMSNLYYKLVVLNYRKDFCSLYKCPPIHKYYFSIPSNNLSEQQFLFTCLCAWLIKDKCQMNLDLEPEEYEDLDTLVGIIVEALNLLLDSDDSKKHKKGSFVNFPPERLKQGFGPEVIWTINILADRALELLVEFDPPTNDKKTNVVFFNKSTVDLVNNRQSVSTSSHIIIGQPFVGGGLTTRPLGSYQIDDKNLLLDGEQFEDHDPAANANQVINEVDPRQWYNQVDKSRPLLESFQYSTNHTGKLENWKTHLESANQSMKAIQDFMSHSNPLMELIINRIHRHLQIIYGREKFIQTNLHVQIDEFLGVWRNYSAELTRNTDLMDQVNLKTDQFENLNTKLRRINTQIEARIKELKDGSRLRELELMIKQLRDENIDFDIKIGLLLTQYIPKS